MQSQDRQLSGVNASSPPPLVSISEASHLLGVSEAALRQWTDEGRIKAFVTPGGHRRYSRAELNRFMLSRPKLVSIKDVVAELEATVPLHREISRTSLSQTLWYHKLTPESQECLADLGRRLFQLIIRYVAEPSRRAETIQLVRNVGYSLGETLAKLGLPLTDSVAAFLLHRDPIMKATAHLLRKGETFNRRVLEAMPLEVHVMDEALTALVAAHQEHREVVHGESRGDAA